MSDEVKKDKPRYSDQFIEVVTIHAEKTQCSAAELVYMFGVGEWKAKQICKIIAERIAATVDERKRKINEARAAANRHGYGRCKLIELFGVSASQAQLIASEAKSFRAKRQAIIKAKKDAAKVYVMEHFADANANKVAKRFGIDVRHARDIIEGVRKALEPKIDCVQKPKRIVRRFAEISHSDMTDDRRRYPSGIGFAVLEVVR